ncbi:MAG: short-chain dehydrogenase [Bacteroidetes bacterium]|nr:short-chain dehydrogenase [Bacteroidota bacterium]MCL5738742.1 short-chain dehydrogenase [Bacteroidota bacterium]
MEIKGKTVLVLGGWGLVGSAICRKLVPEKPDKIIVSSLLKSEALDAVAQMRHEYPDHDADFFVPSCGNIFVREEFKDLPREEILSNPERRRTLINDTLGELSEEVIKTSTIYNLFTDYRPEVIVDCINSATAIAYQDLFQSSRALLKELDKSKEGEQNTLFDSVERLLCTLYTPQLIRHIQILYRSMHDAGTKIYVKIGTSGTGGMGLNIPYTHSEEKPSSVLLSKSAVAGAHTLLMFLMGRTPDAPITKEIKPTAAIAWKRVAYGEIMKRGKPILLQDCSPDDPYKINKNLELKNSSKTTKTNEPLQSVFIDTGENGLFSRGEFEAITTPGQMEYVTPEEIAESVIYEIKGGNTGHDIINALDNATLSPTYRAGYMFHSAFSKMQELEKEHNVDSVAFELLGPPRLSKLLYESYLISKHYHNFAAVTKASAEEMSKVLSEMIKKDSKLRSEIISIGIPILMPDGVSLLRGEEIKIPPFRGENVLPANQKAIDAWAHDGWVDLRVKNMERWKNRFEEMKKMTEPIPAGDTSSRFIYTKEYWNNFETIEPGKIVGWIFSYEEKGLRMKA